jgi:biopolymer transport protein ExbB
MNSQMGLAQLWAQGDFVTRAVAIVLLLMSLASWTVIALKALDLMRYRKMTTAAQTLWSQTDLERALAALEPQADNPYVLMAERGRRARAHLSTSSAQGSAIDMNDWITRNLRQVIDEFTARLQSGLAVLASVGSTAPFIGLFGTVWGIYHALVAIGATGQATIDKVAGPVGEALVMTAFGLIVAIPAVLGYNALVRGNKALLQPLNRFAHDLHAHLLTGSRVSERD